MDIAAASKESKKIYTNHSGSAVEMNVGMIESIFPPTKSIAICPKF